LFDKLEKKIRKGARLKNINPGKAGNPWKRYKNIKKVLTKD
jgi:hypothetical protein